MNSQITERIQTLMLLSIEISQLGQWHVFCNYAGHVDVISVDANDAAQNYNEEIEYKRPFKGAYIKLSPFWDYQDKDAHDKKVITQLDEAIALVEGLRTRDANHAA